MAELADKTSEVGQGGSKAPLKYYDILTLGASHIS